MAEAAESQLSAERHSPEEEMKLALPKDSSTLPKQVIYHFAVGRAIPDPRIED
jgi:hypothetical protein